MKYIIAFLITLFSVSGAIAQEYKTDVSLRSQVLNGTVPGAQYRSGSKSHKLPSSANKQESIGSQIKNNAEPGRQYKKSTGTAVAKGKTASAMPADKALASDKKEEKTEPVATPALPKNLTQ